VVLESNKIRAPIPSVYVGFYSVYYKDIGEFQVLYLGTLQTSGSLLEEAKK
jgi:hypothetical protein